MEYEEAEIANFSEETVVDLTEDLLPILDVGTRWSSTFFFLKRAIRLRRPIDEMAANVDLRANELNDHDWSVLNDICHILKEFADITTIVEGSLYPTLSLVIPMYNRLMTSLEDR